MNRLYLFSLLCLIIIFSGISSARTYYVDSYSGKDSYNGTSSSSPWKTLSKVNSMSFSAGDKILFKKGSVWKETLKIRRDGSSSAPIIYASYGEGNLPVIDGSNSRTNGVYADGVEYIIIRDFYIKNTTYSAFRIKRSKYVTIRNNEIYITGRAGIFIEESRNCNLYKNYLTTPANDFNEQTDGIYGQRNSDNVYNKNNIIIRNENRYEHCDAMQFYLEKSAVIKNNYVEQKNKKSGKAQGIYCSQNNGVFKIYNNIGVGMNTRSSLIKFKNSSTSGTVEMVGNTVYGGQAGLIQTNDPDIIFKNNIVVSTGNNAVIVFERSISSRSNINNNLYNRTGSGSNLIVYKGEAYTLSEWKSAGFDTRGIKANPRFVDAEEGNFQLKGDSPALDKGVNLDAPYDYDRLGIIRPYGTRTDIGAFEMQILPKVNEKENQTAEVSLPDKYELEQNYPNPFNPETTIKFSIPEDSFVSLKVYDLTGSLVVTLIEEYRNAGFYTSSFDASDLASGMYIYNLKAGNYNQTKKMVLLK